MTGFYRRNNKNPTSARLNKNYPNKKPRQLLIWKTFFWQRKINSMRRSLNCNNKSKNLFKTLTYWKETILKFSPKFNSRKTWFLQMLHKFSKIKTTKFKKRSGEKNKRSKTWKKTWIKLSDVKISWSKTFRSVSEGTKTWYCMKNSTPEPWINI